MDVIYNNCYLSQNVISCFLSVVVITHPSHGWGSRFDPSRNQRVNFNPRYGMVDSSQLKALVILSFDLKVSSAKPALQTPSTSHAC